MYILNFLVFITFTHYGNSNVLIRKIRDSDDDSWTYVGDNGPKNWAGVCNNGKKQSPIDIGGDRKRLDGPPILFKGYDEVTDWKVSWSGHSHVAHMVDSDLKVSIEDGSLDDEYIFRSLHIHYGSEHTVHGRRYTAELHLVHYNSKFTFKEAVNQPDGLAVIGIFLDDTDDAEESAGSKFLERIIEYDEKEIDKMTLNTLLPGLVEPWVRYFGSLTTPTCSENVKWTVLLNPLRVPSGLIKKFQKTYSNSFRPTQNLNNRTIYIQSDDVVNTIEATDSARSNYNFNFIIINLAIGNLIISKIV